MNRLAKTFLLTSLLGVVMVLASTEANAMKVYFNDGKIEYVDYQPGTIHIKLTRAGVDYGSAYMQARDLARRVQARRPHAFRHWPAININKLALRIQAHAVWAAASPVQRGRGNPVDVTWREIT
jgi:hypothetical protein